MIVGCQLKTGPSKLPTPPSEMVEFSPRTPVSWVLSNGLTVLYLGDTELPLVQGSLYIKGGSFWEPDGPVGSVGAMGDQMRQGGAGDLSADALDSTLEKLSAGVGSSFGGEFGRIGFSSLSSDVDQVFSIFADVVLRPRFDEERLSVWKGQALESIHRRADDPGTIASIAIGQLLYGNSVYGSITTQKDVENISKELLVKLHKKWVYPDEAILAVSGAITREKLETLVTQYFGHWEPRKSQLPPLSPAQSFAAPGIYFVEGPFQQSTIIMGQLGVPRLTPDYVQIEGFNELFSGSFASRLFARIRTELGLAYSVYGGISPGVVRGINSISVQTKSETTERAIVEAFRVLARLQEEEPKAEELKNIRRTIENSFVFKFSSTEKLVERGALLKMLGFPADYDAVHLEKVRNLRPLDLRAVAQERWDLSQFVVVVVGNEKAYNSLKERQTDTPRTFQSLPLIKLRFDQKLQIPE